jgi:hypothetical protein
MTPVQASSTTVAPPPDVSLNLILGRMKKWRVPVTLNASLDLSQPEPAIILNARIASMIVASLTEDDITDTSDSLNP